MKVHRFECKNHHIFFIPINLPMGMDEFAQILKNITCPLCHLKSDYINIHAQQFTVQ